MKHSESIKEIAAALPKAQAALKSAVKGARNPHFNSSYATLAAVIEACREALNSNGITLLQPVRASEKGVVVETILLHTSAEWISEELELPVVKQDPQGVGSAITYGKRYGLQSLIGIPSEEDDGNRATAGNGGDTQPAKLAETIVADLKADMDSAVTKNDLRDKTRKALTMANNCGDMNAYEAFREHSKTVADRITA